YIVESLGRNFDPARIECARRVADYRALFARAALMTAEAVRDEIEAIKRHAEGRKTVADLPMLQSGLERIRRGPARDTAHPTLREKRMQKFSQDAEAWGRQSRLEVAPIVAAIVKDSDPPITPGSAAWNEVADKVRFAQLEGRSDYSRAEFESRYGADVVRPKPEGETITQAAEAWFAEMRRPDAGVRRQTLDGHRLRVRAFIEHCGDIPLASVTRARAADFLTAIASGRSNRTVNNYCQTMLALFKDARNRG